MIRRRGQSLLFTTRDRRRFPLGGRSATHRVFEAPFLVYDVVSIDDKAKTPQKTLAAPIAPLFAAI